MRFVYDAGIFDLFFLMSGEFYDEKNNGIFLRGLAAGLGLFFFVVASSLVFIISIILRSQGS